MGDKKDTQTSGSAGGSEDKTFNQADVDRIVSERLARENGKFADYDELKTKAGQFDELEQSKKSELDKLTEQNTQLQTELAEAKSDSLRSRVAHEKGLTPAQARRLVGGTQEELETDADELLASFTPADSAGGGATKRPPDGKPKEQLKPGSGDPDAGADDDEIDYDALARQV